MSKTPTKKEDNKKASTKEEPKDNSPPKKDIPANKTSSPSVDTKKDKKEQQPTNNANNTNNTNKTNNTNNANIGIMPNTTKNNRANSTAAEEVLGEPRIVTSVLVEYFPSRQELFDLVDKYMEASELPKHYKGYNKGSSLELTFENSVSFIINYYN